LSFFNQPFQSTRHNFVFAHGASGFAKNPGKAPTLTPEEDRAYFSVQVGEDAYFRRHDALGVADGVGGWCGTTGKLHAERKSAPRNLYLFGSSVIHTHQTPSIAHQSELHLSIVHQRETETMMPLSSLSPLSWGSGTCSVWA
jgi:hypothetical protein